MLSGRALPPLTGLYSQSLSIYSPPDRVSVYGVRLQGRLRHR